VGVNNWRLSNQDLPKLNISPLETDVPFKYAFHPPCGLLLPQSPLLHSTSPSRRRFVSAMAAVFSIRSVRAPSPASAWLSQRVFPDLFSLLSCRAYTESMRQRTAAELGPLAIAARDLPPMEVKHFRWWEDELAFIKASEADDEEEAAPGKGRAPKKRSISDLFAAAPPVDPSGSRGTEQLGEDDDEEVLGAIVRRAKELRRRRREEEAEAAAAAETATAAARAAEPLSAGEARDSEENSSRQVWSSPAHLDPAHPNPSC
jgi:hypothetical protein